MSAPANQHCAKCHNSKAPKGKLDLSPVIKNVETGDIELLRQINEVVTRREMPPEDASQPSDDENSGEHP